MQENDTQHTLASATFAILYVLSISWFAFPEAIFRFMLAGFLLFIILFAYYSRKYFRRIGRDSFWPILGNTAFFVGWSSLFLLAPSKFLQISFLVISLPISFLVIRLQGIVGESVQVIKVILSSVAFFLLVAGGSSFYFKLPAVWYLSSVFIFSVITARAAYEITPLDTTRKLLNSLVVGLLTTQFFWVFSFFPFHYSVLGLLSFEAFFVIWQLNYYFIFNRFSRQKVGLLALLIIFATLLVLMVTPWSVVQV